MNITSSKSKIVLSAYMFFILSAIALIYSDNAQSEGKVKMNPKDFFCDFIEKLENAQPYSKEKIEALLNAQLVVESENTDWIYYISKQVGSNSFRICISGIDLRIKKNDPKDPGFLSIETFGVDIDPDAVRMEYPDAELLLPIPGPPPQGIPPDAILSYWTKRAWGKISFGFRLSDPRRLSQVSFHTE